MNSQNYIVSNDKKMIKINHLAFDTLLNTGYRRGKTLEEQLEEIRNLCRREFALCGNETDHLVFTWFVLYIEDIKEKLFPGITFGMKEITKEELEQMTKGGEITEI